MNRGGGGLTIHLMFRHSDHRTREDLVAFKKEGVGVLEIAGMVIVPEPSGEGAAERIAMLKSSGVEIVRGIIESNSPLAGTESRRDLARRASRWVAEST
jgi:hypothetical protein